MRLELSLLRRRRHAPMTRVEALRSLVANLRSGAPMRIALAGWADGAPEGARPFLQAASRRARLGAPLVDALAPCEGLFGEDHGSLVAAVELHLTCGADAASMIDGLAREISQREVEAGSARAHAAGARLSARLIGGLPLAFVPLMPPSKVELVDPLGLGFLITGLALGLGGLRWVSRLLPEPPSGTDPTVMAATHLGVCLEAGVDLSSAVYLAARRAGNQDEHCALARAARRVYLGISVTKALAASDDPGLISIARCIERAERSGVPPAKELARLADARRAEIRRIFEEEMRRAPVKMVVPLTLCVLPSFALLGLAPFLRGVTIGA